MLTLKLEKEKSQQRSINLKVKKGKVEAVLGSKKSLYLFVNYDLIIKLLNLNLNGGGNRRLLQQLRKA